MKSAFEKLLRARPLLWLAGAFMAGLLAASETDLPLFSAFVGLVFGLALLAWRRVPVLVGILLIGLSLGLLRYGVFCSVRTNDISHVRGDAPVSVIGIVASDATFRPGRTAFFLEARQVQEGNVWTKVSGQTYVSVYAYADQTEPRINDGDRLQLDGILQTPKGATNPGGFSWKDYLARRAVWCQMRVKRPRGVRLLGSSFPNLWIAASSHARDTLLRSMRVGLSSMDVAVLSGILLGRRADLPPALMADFVATGTVHILATAGLHVGIVSMILMWLFSRITLPRQVAAGVMIATLWLYALMAGGRPSVTRAAFMASVYFAALLFKRVPDLPTSLAAAALVVLWLQPTAILEPAFQMSFMTVLGLIVLMPVWTDLWATAVKAFKRKGQRAVAHWVVEMVGLSFIAQLAAMPVVAQAYNQVSALGFFANLCVVPALFILIPLGFFASLVGMVSPWAAGLLFKAIVAPVLHYVVAMVTFFAALPGSSFSVRTLPPLAVACYYGMICGGGIAIRALANRRSRQQPPASIDPPASPASQLAGQYGSD